MLKNKTYRQKFVLPVINLLRGEKNGKKTGQKLSIVAIDAEIKNNNER